MINEASKKDIAWGYLSQFLNIGAGIILIPIAIKYLSAEDMGLWYVFIALVGLAQLLEFGFQPTIARHTSYVYSGATQLCAQGIPKCSNNGLNQQLLVDLIFASKKLYRYVAYIAAFILLVFGSVYIYSLEVEGFNNYIAWFVFSTSSAINFYFSYFNGLLQGRGQQTVLNQIIAQSKVVLLLIAIPLLILDFGLQALAIATFISMLVNRYLVYIQFYDKTRSETYFISNQEKSMDVYAVIFLSSWRLGLTSLGAFLIQRGNLFIVSSFLGLKVTGSYGLTMQLLGILSAVSSIMVTLNIPKMTILQATNNRIEIKRIFYTSLTIAVLMFILGSASLVIIGLPLINMLSKEVSLVGLGVLLLMLLFQLLEMIHSLCATYLTTLNYVPFVKAALVSGIFIVSIGLLLANYTSYGLVALVLSQGAIQLLFNNWYWPLQVYKNLTGPSNEL